jgi:hypothetical protein
MNKTIKSAAGKLRRFSRDLRKNNSGVAAIEYAYILPVFVCMTAYGMEMANLAIDSQKVSQAAMALADNMSRVGLDSALATVQLRESDVNDGFIGIQKQSTALDLTTRGRVILSSLERNASGGQWIHWQRCIGLKNVVSSYGTQGTGATGTSFLGMGSLSTARITAPANSAVMFVEIVYDYKPLFVTIQMPNSLQSFSPARTIRYEASFIVRDNRDMSGGGIFNPTPSATAKTCATFSAT